MLAAPDTHPIDVPPLQMEISMPYTLTPGKAAGTFLAEIVNRRIVGCRFTTSGKVAVPALDFCPASGDDVFEFVEAPHTGELTAFTETGDGIIGLIRIDGSDFDFPHRVTGAAYDALKVGMRVKAVWQDGIENSILSLASFTPDAAAPVGKCQPLNDPAEAIAVIPSSISLKYEHAFGPYYGRLFDELKTNRRIMGVRVSDGELALLPPRPLDDITHKPTGTWVAAKNTGTVKACSVIHLEFLGQKQPPPYVYAEIILDGACTRLIHNVKCKDMANAKDLVKPGTRVQAVWGDKRTGTLEDIDWFEVIDDA